MNSTMFTTKSILLGIVCSIMMIGVSMWLDKTEDAVSWEGLILLSVFGFGISVFPVALISSLIFHRSWIRHFIFALTIYVAIGTYSCLDINEYGSYSDVLRNTLHYVLFYLSFFVVATWRHLHQAYKTNFAEQDAAPNC